MSALSSKASRLARVAVLVDQLAGAVETSRLPKAERNAIRLQVLSLIDLLAARNTPEAVALSQALDRLADRLSQTAVVVKGVRRDAGAGQRFSRALRRIALIITAGAVVSAPMAAAAADVLNPVTGVNEQIVETISPAVVRTAQGNFILLVTTVGQSFTDPQDNKVYKVTAVTKNSDGRVIKVDVEDSANAKSTLSVVTNRSGDIDGVTSGPGGTNGAGTGSFTFPTASGDNNVFTNARFGANGGGGSNGGGVRVCVPFLGCATIGYSPTSGGSGQNGPTLVQTIDAGWGNIQTVSNNLPGIVVSSVGGDGGKGGNAFGNLAGAAGGAAGRGGDVTVSSSVAVTTTGQGSHGIFVQSRSGAGGKGGTGYIAGSGGTGGGAGQGGTVNVTNTGQISTSGQGAIGILAQSLGGAAGGGGDSYGIIGDAGGGTIGGNGGSVVVNQNGIVQTSGKDAHGVLSQSIGGSGGNAGDAGGIVSFGDSGKAGGNGGSAAIVAGAGSSTTTSGEGAIGLFAQSIGGGGGNGGVSIGLVSLGSGGGPGGNGGSASVTVEGGASVTTTGTNAHAIFAQSVGGGGGSAGITGALVVALGASADAGGTGGAVQVTSGGVISTQKSDSRGIFAQSVGGGGGAAQGTGGLVALGGEGAAGGTGGNVTVSTTAGGSVTTLGDGSDGVFAQSVGGGGGSGSGTGGVVALGGKGGGGGGGGIVNVTNGGQISTSGSLARGVFAQSVGGGGGTGGDGGALVAIGGSGGKTSLGGAVTVGNSGTISTKGNQSSAIQAQSIGGGGGDGGSTGGVLLTIGGGGTAGGGSGLVTVNHSGDLITQGNDSHGIFAQSVGGGGGNGGSSSSISLFAGVAIGGNGGTGGDGGAVDINLSQSAITSGGATQMVDPLIVTSGDRSRGIFAQSVGGGGGNGGFAAQVAVGYGVGASAAVGGSAGDGGLGGAVNLDGDVTILTKGDNSEGVFAQSVGGGGGAGGYAVSFSFAAGETAAAAFSVALGGKGGGGGAGGAVTLDSGGAIFTEGDFSTGLQAQSVGGGGGSGGFSVAFAGSAAGAASASAAVGIGGSGGKGGAGGVVDATFDGTIKTDGDDARGAVIQSVGGGGGNGGFNISGAVSISGGPGIGAAAGVGGYGGDGGAGGSATGHIGGAVQTGGDRSTGVVVQSIGGGGGAGGFNVSGSIGGGGTYGGALSIGIGGSGGGGGVGGSATGSTGSTVYTTGDQSGGLLVQSVGGGGGSGGFNVSGAIGGGASVGTAVSIGIGGSGGGGGAGGSVRGDALGFVETTGKQSTGVTVQSIGGGGGSGGFNVAGGIGVGGSVGAAVSVGVGGAGGNGGAGGEVDASAIGITTRGDQSGGFLAQSVGGGGGAGAFNVAGGIGGSNSVGAALSVGVGGAGGGGGDGGRVGGKVTGDVTTYGAGSDAVIAQSIGGGGGSGGLNVAGGIAGGGSAAGAISVGVGGSGGTGGIGGAVTLAVIGATQTAGKDSDGIIAQSVGGGGGNGGMNVTGNIAVSGTGAGTIGVGVGGQGGGGGKAGDVTLQVNQGVLDPNDTLLAALTMGDGARAVIAQSIGGGGGSGGVNVTGGVSASKDGAGNIGVGVGGGGGDGGDGGAVIGQVTGDVKTAGARASAVLVQSVGGGGGDGGFNITGGVAGSKTVAGNLLVGVGGFGGGGGNAGAVSGGVTGDILTLGAQSFGASYQSLGGGGGNGAFNITGGVSLTVGSGGGAGTIGVGIGGFGGDGGDGSTVDATLIGDISTSGYQAHGALLQSAGGGGGTGGFNITGGISASSGVSGVLGFGLGGFGGGGGKGDKVTGTLTGDVTTRGDEAFGAMLQSLGGGGGAGGMNVTGSASFTVTNNASAAIGIGVGGFGGDGGDAGKVIGTVTGQYITTGANADGVVAQSLGGGGGNGGLNVSGALTISSGTAGTASIGVGGFGGAGGDSDDVTLTRVGDTQTDGANSDGVVIQSLAGGGGNGGINISGGLSVSTSGSAGSLGIGVGGFGGGGGDAGDVFAHVTGNVHALGLLTDQTFTFNDPDRTDYRRRAGGSNGILAQSVGGGGGTGGMNITGDVSISASKSQASRAVSVGIGGFGGAGGDAGFVSLTVDAPTSTRVQVSAVGDDRSAVIAQSVGGSGGMGGIDISGSITLDGALTVGVGGFGGDGGLGGNVVAKVDADLFAAGNNSRGLMAQSVGGGGGAGGINISGGITAGSTTKEPSLVFGLGGFGGAGNRSGDVIVTQNGQVMVEGVGSIGVLVQSVAGGGGSGGLNVSGAATNGKGGYAMAVGIGGSGGDGADAGDVSLNSVGNIFVNAKARANPTTGQDPYEAVDFTGGAVGILAQSVGGGGGVGAISATGVVALKGNPMAIGVGGSGGSGGDGGKVSVTRGYVDKAGVETAAPGVIRTFGDDSAGLIAQSVGGGGGRAGMNFTFAATVSADEPTAALISVGGSGAGAGSGDTVTVRHNGDIMTSGASSDGLFAQSVGGGGGSADLNIGFGVLRKANALRLAVGGDVGAGGSGGVVSVEHDGTIVTKGRASVGVRAQSIGGGGGNTSIDMALGILATNSLSVTLGRQGGAGGTGGNVSVNTDGIIDTSGDEASGVMAQSIGGGGGASSATTIAGQATTGTGAKAETYNASLSIGIDGGVGASSGDVSVVTAGRITTRGDDARGVIAQSIGGGGGVGGSASNAIVKASGAATIGVGGAGGTGATSGKVSVANAAIIATTGDRSDGVLAQSIGGGGGLGGVARTLTVMLGINASTDPTTTASVNIGGNGGSGAVAGAVDVTNTGTIATAGDQSFGIRAQSIGGGGGVGGAVLNLRVEGSRSSASVNLNVGGSGGSGGAGGAVSVVNRGLIYTEGRDAAGISANSIGGGGGDAGFVLDLVAGAPGAKNETHRFVANFGGSGGSGGSGGDVTVTNQKTATVHTGEIVTKGAGAYGIFAQSLGGGGGNGSSVVSLVGLSTGKDSVIAGLNIGGFGGTGNTGGKVVVTNDGLIDTSGAGAHGILAQSIGGGGGNGGMVIAANAVFGGAASNSPLISIGGLGGDGGDAGSVTVTNTGTIVTRGAGADGIVAQSIGGGGGNAAMGFSLTGEAKSFVISNTLAGIVGAVGGGSGGAGGAVTVNHSGNITVLGEGSLGIKAESINGGGGTLSLDFKGLLGLPGVPFIGSSGLPERPDPIVVARAGASKVSGMNAGLVTVNTTGTFGAAGDNGVASFNQAVGGGGGTVNIRAVLATQLDDPTAPDAPAPVQFQVALGGVDGVNNNGGDIVSSHSGDIVTTGRNTPGALIQSIGGGGGRAVIDITRPQGALLGPIQLDLGGQNGTGEAGGDVQRIHTGVIVTTGDLAPAAILQSIGGGGGSALVSVHGQTTTGATAASRLLAAGVPGAAVNGTLGAKGGSGLDAGAVTGTFSGGMQTQGAYAPALIVQSLGAGGGEMRLAGVDTLTLALGGTDGVSGDGGVIDLTNSGAIATSGAHAHGVFLQSIGGGGGAVFGNIATANVTLRGDNSGDGGAITFKQTGDIAVSGVGSYGVIAQSLGGGGGWVEGAFAGTAGGAGRGGAINLNLSGRVMALNTGSVGVLAQSLGADGGGAIHLTSDGLIRGGDGAGSVGVRFEGGASNVIDTSGSISAVSGRAIQTTTGDDLVNNSGLIVGDIDLGGGVNAFMNRAGATFIAFHTIDLRDAPGSASTFTNAGEFLMGLSAPVIPIDLAKGSVFANLDGMGAPATNLLYGARVINTVALDGNFVQTATGHMAFDVAFGPYASDRVNVTGDALVNGKGDVTLTWLENAAPVTLFATGGKGVDNGLKITDTLALDYSIKGDDDGVHLSFVSNFGQNFLNTNGRALGGHMDSAISAGGSSGIGRLMGLIGNLRAGDEALYTSIFNELNPEPYLAPLQTQFDSSRNFSRQIFSCAAPGLPHRDQCVWARLETGRFERDGDFDSLSIKSESIRFTSGFERPLDDRWSLAGAFGYDRTDGLTVDRGRLQGEADGFHLGVGAKRVSAGGTEIGLSLSGGWQRVKAERQVNVFEPLVGRSQFETGYLQANARIAQTFRKGDLFVRPALNVSATALHQAKFSEKGLEGIGVQGLSDTQVIATANPEIGLGLVTQDSGPLQSSITFTVGGVFNSDDRIEMPYRLLGANPSASAANIGTPIDRSAYRVGLDFNLSDSDRFAMKVGYAAEIGAQAESKSVRLDLTWRF